MLDERDDADSHRRGPRRRHGRVRRAVRAPRRRRPPAGPLAWPATATPTTWSSEAFAKVLPVLLRGDGPDMAFRPYLLTAVRRLARRPAPLADPHPADRRRVGPRRGLPFRTLQRHRGGRASRPTRPRARSPRCPSAGSWCCGTPRSRASGRPRSRRCSASPPTRSRSSPTGPARGCARRSSRCTCTTPASRAPPARRPAPTSAPTSAPASPAATPPASRRTSSAAARAPRSTSSWSRSTPTCAACSRRSLLGGAAAAYLSDVPVAVAPTALASIGGFLKTGPGKVAGRHRGGRAHRHRARARRHALSAMRAAATARTATCAAEAAGAAPAAREPALRQAAASRASR